MARSHANNGRIYRAVIVRRFDSGKVQTYTNGPYDTPSAAKAQITAHESTAKASRNRYRDPANAFDAVGHIESAEVIWMRESAEE